MVSMWLRGSRPESIRYGHAAPERDASDVTRWIQVATGAKSSHRLAMKYTAESGSREAKPPPLDCSLCPRVVGWSVVQGYSQPATKVLHHFRYEFASGFVSDRVWKPKHEEKPRQFVADTNCFLRRQGEGGEELGRSVNDDEQVPLTVVGGHLHVLGVHPEDFPWLEESGRHHAELLAPRSAPPAAHAGQDIGADVFLRMDQ